MHRNGHKTVRFGNFLSACHFLPFLDNGLCRFTGVLRKRDNHHRCERESANGHCAGFRFRFRRMNTVRK